MARIHLLAAHFTAVGGLLKGSTCSVLPMRRLWLPLVLGALAPTQVSARLGEPVLHHPALKELSKRFALSSTSPTGGSGQGGEALYSGSKDAVFTIITPNRTGSGFVIGNDLLVTCYHVVKGAGSRIRMKEAPGVQLQYVAHSEDLDLAVFQADSSLPTRLELSDQLSPIGSSIFVLGSPLGSLTRSFSNGLVSQHRKIGSNVYLQFTAPISPGSSGGPVLSQAGKVVGIVDSSIEEGQSNNFALASSEVLSWLRNRPKQIELPTAKTPTFKKVKHVGEEVSIQFTKPAVCHAAPDINSPVALNIRALRITVGYRTSSPNWVAIVLENGSYAYVPSSSVVLAKHGSKIAGEWRDPFNVTPPKNFDKLLVDSCQYSDEDLERSATNELLAYGPRIVKHVIARFEFSYDLQLYKLLLEFSRLGPPMVEEITRLWSVASESQLIALGDILAYASETLQEQRDIATAVDADPWERDFAKKQIAQTSWVESSALLPLIGQLFQSEATAKQALEITASMRLSQFRSKTIAALKSNNIDLALKAFDALCAFANQLDRYDLESQFRRISKSSHTITASGENLDSSALIISLEYGKSPVCYEVLLALLDDSDPWVRANVCEALESHPSAQTISRLKPLIKDVNLYVRCNAILALCKLAPVESIQDAIPLVRSLELYERVHAALSLGSTKLDTAIPFLEKLCNDEVDVVRAAARAGLGAHKSDKAVAVLRDLLASPDPEVRRDAREILARMGKALRPRSSESENLSRLNLPDVHLLLRDVGLHRGTHLQLAHIGQSAYCLAGTGVVPG